ncbi:MAG: glycosyltransferase family 2 protein, partial [Saprospiraceae bacterium]|nr:glycosyltransferase family 2 protein [Saprospiraceae bacterium]
ETTNRISHIPKVLYHWRKGVLSTASDKSNKEYVDESSTKALTDYMERNKISGKVRDGLFHGSWRIERDIQLVDEKVSIIIPFKDEVNLLEKCIVSILDKTKYGNYEIVLVSNNSKKQETFDYIQKITADYDFIQAYEHNIPFNFSKINNWAIQKTSGDFLLFLNNDTEVISRGWMTAMVEHIQREEVGAVGAKLLFPNDTIQHAGVILGIGGVAAHVHNHQPRSSLGYFGRASITQNLSACTGACLMVRRAVFLVVDGFDEMGLSIAFNDIDLCLKIRELGYLIVYTPYSQLVHHESVSRGYEDTPRKLERFKKEIACFREKWKDILEKGDPYYNPNLTLDRTDFSLSIK